MTITSLDTALELMDEIGPKAVGSLIVELPDKPYLRFLPMSLRTISIIQRK